VPVNRGRWNAAPSFFESIAEAAKEGKKALADFLAKQAARDLVSRGRHLWCPPVRWKGINAHRTQHLNISDGLEAEPLVTKT
jgi:hypothetical protein